MQLQLKHMKSEDEMVFQKTIQIEPAQTDAAGRITPGTLARLVQMAADEHLSKLGLDAEALRKQGLLWVLAWSSFWVQRLPRGGETVVLRTWSGGERNWQFSRRYVFQTEQGVPLISASSLWLLVDQKTRRLSSPEELLRTVPQTVLPNEPKLPAQRMPFPTELNMQKERMVQEHEIDHNGHLNNAFYLDWAVQLLDPMYIKTHSLRFLWVEYSQELLQGQKAFLHYTLEQDTLFVRGYTEQTPSFSLRMDFVPDSGGKCR